MNFASDRRYQLLPFCSVLLCVVRVCNANLYNLKIENDCVKPKLRSERSVDLFLYENPSKRLIYLKWDLFLSLSLQAESDDGINIKNTM